MMGRNERRVTVRRDRQMLHLGCSSRVLYRGAVRDPISPAWDEAADRGLRTGGIVREQSGVRMMKANMIMIAVAAGSLAMAAGAASAQVPAQQPAAGSTGSATAARGAAPNISPNDPAYSENGAPRPGQPSGYDTAGAPSASGNYAPVQHERTRGGGFSR
jgi:hypothetical protein